MPSLSTFQGKSRTIRFDEAVPMDGDYDNLRMNSLDRAFFRHRHHQRHMSTETLDLGDFELYTPIWIKRDSFEKTAER